MSKTFRYTKFTGHYYCQYSDEWEEDGVEFDYEVEDSDLLPVITDLLFNEYFLDDKLICSSQNLVKSIKERLRKMVEENDLIEALADQYEETLKETFQAEALQFYED